MARWIPSERGHPLQIDLIECVIVAPAEPQVFEVRAFMSGGGDESYYVLFSHPSSAVCAEWRDEFVKRTGGVMPRIFLPRTCPECTGVGLVGKGVVCANCDGKGTVLVDPAQIPAEEVE